MIETMFDMHISLILETSEEIQTITDFFGVKPTDLLIKGQSRSKVIEKATKNHWIFTQKRKNLKKIGNSIIDFLNEIPDFSNKISRLKGDTKALIRLSVISDYAQIGFCLSADDLKLLNNASIPLEISILSWGGCQDPNTGDGSVC